MMSQSTAVNFFKLNGQSNETRNPLQVGLVAALLFHNTRLTVANVLITEVHVCWCFQVVEAYTVLACIITTLSEGFLSSSWPSGQIICLQLSAGIQILVGSYQRLCKWDLFPSRLVLSIRDWDRNNNSCENLTGSTTMAALNNIAPRGLRMFRIDKIIMDICKEL